ncbi:MAG: hypothetical protein QGF59_04070 [Pirellulaceae bacterium]|jgi:hypothetical protein|nr:hypothetical protein [Pirellulaceae bacterium]
MLRQTDASQPTPVVDVCLSKVQHMAGRARQRRRVVVAASSFLLLLLAFWAVNWRSHVPDSAEQVVPNVAQLEAELMTIREQVRRHERRLMILRELEQTQRESRVQLDEIRMLADAIGRPDPLEIAAEILVEAADYRAEYLTSVEDTISDYEHILATYPNTDAAHRARVSLDSIRSSR